MVGCPCHCQHGYLHFQLRRRPAENCLKLQGDFDPPHPTPQIPGRSIAANCDPTRCMLASTLPYTLPPKAMCSLSTEQASLAADTP